ncbi:MAG: hypothetical protein AB8B81_15665 [Halioglobus sp.]
MNTQMSRANTTSNFDPRKVAWAVAAISLLAVPFAYVQEELMGQLSQTWVLVYSLALLLSVGVAGYFLVFRHLSASIRRDPYLFFFVIFAFAAIIDLLISLTLLGYSDLMRSYAQESEPYLQSSHGAAILFWDGTVHFTLYVWLCFCIASSTRHFKSALFWAGSMIGSSFVYLIANLIGEYAEHIEPAYLLNVPFMLVPAFYVWRVSKDSGFSQYEERPPASLQVYLLALALLAISLICAYRMLVVLAPQISATVFWAGQVEPYLLSPSRYPQVQMIAYGMYVAPFAIIAIISLWRAPSAGIALWSWIMAGIVAQGQFAHIFATGISESALTSQHPLFWIANLIVLAVPLWFAHHYSGRFSSAGAAVEH